MMKLMYHYNFLVLSMKKLLNKDNATRKKEKFIIVIFTISVVA